MARPERLELPTYWFEASRSIQLSYGRAEFMVIHSAQRLSAPVSDIMLPGEFVNEAKPAPLKGSARGLFLYDVCEEIQLERVRSILGAQRSGEAFKHAAAEQISFERPPVVEDVKAPEIAGSDRLQARVKYYDYGIISVLLEFPFAGGWDDLIALSAGWMSGTDFETHAREIAMRQALIIQPAMIKPYRKWLSEDYFIFFVREMSTGPTAAELLSSCGQQITQVVRGERSPLAESERAEVLQSAISYYPNDLAVVGWNAAFIYDSVAGADTALELLEYANSQLLEFRHYDDLLIAELESVYSTLERKARWPNRWRLPQEASRLQTVLIEVRELTERVDNAIKFLSDMFAARLYRLAASKVGVADYKTLVMEKLSTAEGLYRFLTDQFHQARSFVLESLVVIILVVELIYVFRGKL
jgi:hypothetical protein